MSIERQPLVIHRGLAVPFDKANVDTDQIIPKQFLRKVSRTGFGAHLFHDWRYLDDLGTQPNPEFILNEKRYQGASVLLARENFGCGSSREHAPWAIAEYGFRVVIASSFADIFYSNCMNNLMPAVRLKEEEIDELFQAVVQEEGCWVGVNLEKQEVIGPSGKLYPFDIDPFHKECLLKGVDQIGWILRYEEQIQSYETELAQTRPWLA